MLLGFQPPGMRSVGGFQGAGLGGFQRQGMSLVKRDQLIQRLIIPGNRSGALVAGRFIFPRKCIARVYLYGPGSIGLHGLGAGGGGAACAVIDLFTSFGETLDYSLPIPATAYATAVTATAILSHWATTLTTISGISSFGGTSSGGSLNRRGGHGGQGGDGSLSPDPGGGQNGLGDVSGPGGGGGGAGFGDIDPLLIGGFGGAGGDDSVGGGGPNGTPGGGQGENATSFPTAGPAQLVIDMFRT